VSPHGTEANSIVVLSNNKETHMVIFCFLIVIKSCFTYSVTNFIIGKSGSACGFRLVTPKTSYTQGTLLASSSHAKIAYSNTLCRFVATTSICNFSKQILIPVLWSVLCSVTVQKTTSRKTFI